MPLCLELTESSLRRLPLTPRQASVLNDLGQELASKKEFWGNTFDDASRATSTIIRCRPAVEGFYDVVVDNAVGMICVDNLTITVKPKIDQRHLIFLMAISGALPRSARDSIGLATDDNLTQLLASWFIRSIQTLLRGDLLRDYREARDDLVNLRGHLDVVDSMTNYYSGSLRLRCTFEEFDEDMPLNRVLKAAAKVLAHGRGFREEVRASARQVIYRLDTVSNIRPEDIRVEPHRRERAYADAIILAKAIIRAEVRSLGSGTSHGYCFLLSTPGPVEAAIRQLLMIGLSDVCRVAKFGQQLRGSTMTISPDLRFIGLDAVGDIKYKIYEGAWSRSDLYQSVAFAAALNCSRAAIFSFDSGGFGPLGSVGFGDILVSNVTWSCASEDAPDIAAQRFISDAREWLTGSPSEERLVTAMA